MESSTLLQRMRPILDWASDNIDTVRTRSAVRRLRGFLIHNETSVMIFSCFVVASFGLLINSVKLSGSPPPAACQVALASDPNFFANISQAVLSILSVYLTILPVIRTKSFGLTYRFWFWSSLAISALSSVTSLALYHWHPVVSGVFSWAGAFFQVAITLLLTLSIEDASKAGSLDALELHEN